ncbi:hypothetical protein [Candidatus Odyssella acanthamoebae]|uniref:Outer membrane protein beta-barrel domain-containing protein n=1 Tax=Candidatus Odyssella acanthamoebae TaxID=91604 RepID=A0A077ATW5_9PROT|nr:hypothetical protein [Candidatus Paracaedibacter acanthamoebae]AIK95836.1 hypothetical protein ID47_02430 [Candidatus Paracaedibacter acanthamoebae]
MQKILKGNRYDNIFLTQDSYIYPKRLKEFGSVLGGHIGISKEMSQWILGTELEANLMSTKHTIRQYPVDTSGPNYKNYHQEFSHVGNIGVGFKVGRILVPCVTVYAKPIVTFDYFRTKTSYTQGLNIEDTPLHFYRKTRKIVGTGLAMGIERRIDSFKIGTEIRYIKHRSLQRSLEFNPVESGNFKAKPKTIAATIRISYCF